MAVFSQSRGAIQKSAVAADKTGMQILAIAQQGLQQAQSQVEKAAQGIARTGLEAAPDQAPAPADTINLSDQMVSLMSARNQFKTDLTLAHTADEMQKQTLDLLA
jgi:hypothetical protein